MSRRGEALLAEDLCQLVLSSLAESPASRTWRRGPTVKSIFSVFNSRLLKSINLKMAARFVSSTQIAAEREAKKIAQEEFLQEVQ